jgi:hypothetical protein
VGAGAEHLQAAELVERHGDSVEVGVFAQYDHLRAHRWCVGNAGLASSRETDPVWSRQCSGPKLSCSLEPE